LIENLSGLATIWTVKARQMIFRMRLTGTWKSQRRRPIGGPARRLT
jgi:hypothetical protein